MLYMDYSQVRARQNAREIELVRAYEKDQLLQHSCTTLNPITRHAFDRVGDSLIRLGERLKEASHGHSKLWIAARDADCRKGFS